MLLYAFFMVLARYQDFANTKQQGTPQTCTRWNDWKVATRCLQHRGDVDDGVGCLGIPIHLGQVFIYQSPGKRAVEVGSFPHCQEIVRGEGHVEMEGSFARILCLFERMLQANGRVLEWYISLDGYLMFVFEHFVAWGFRVVTFWCFESR